MSLPLVPRVLCIVAVHFSVGTPVGTLGILTLIGLTGVAIPTDPHPNRAKEAQGMGPEGQERALWVAMGGRMRQVCGGVWERMGIFVSKVVAWHRLILIRSTRLHRQARGDL